MDLARYAELFRTESREHLAAIDVALLALETNRDASQVAVLFRSMHTIKGMAAAMGYTDVEGLSHALEELLDELRNGTRTLDADVVAQLFNGSDALRTAVENAGIVRNENTAEAPKPEREPLRHVRIDARRLDTLLELAGELVITRDRLVRATDKGAAGMTGVAAERALATIVHDTARLVSALQEEVLRTRMVPVGQVFDRFPRLVRDLARDLGREVSFVTEGRDIELDRSLLDAIGDPVVHLLRNAIDHGIEPPAERRTAGKAPAGRLVLRATRDRGSVVVQVIDDGRGINRQRVLERARAEGAVPATTEELTDELLVRVLSRAGFSTAASVTTVSGRGVGIDVVASRVRSLAGTLEIDSTFGVGTTFTVRLPVTLAIVRALLVRVGAETYALPAAHVLEAVEVAPDAEHTANGRDTVTLRDEVIPLLRLRDRFHIPRTRNANDGERHLVVIEAGGHVTALEVDGLVGQQDIVVKPYDSVHGAETLFTGATILGDGTPALIVDLGSLT